MSTFTEWVDLAAERNGGVVVFANDDFFAPKENLIKPGDPVAQPGRFTDHGAWMDGWETRRRRSPGFDHAIIRLGLAGVLHRVVVDTRHFKGNFPEACAVDAVTLPGDAAPESLEGADLDWIEVVPQSELAGDTVQAFEVVHPQRFTHVRLRIFPDGGVARLRVLGEVVPEIRRFQEGDVDLASAVNGGLAVDCSDKFFGDPDNLLQPGAAVNMSDGWETRRRRGPGNDWCIIRLAAEGTIACVEVDTTHFKGNYPDTCTLEGARLGPGARPEDWSRAEWAMLLPHTKLQPHTQHRFTDELTAGAPVDHVRFSIYPDGGVARLRLTGHVSEAGRRFLGLRWLNTLPADRATEQLLGVCGSARWAETLAGARPFVSADALEQAAAECWWALSERDWAEAFAAHPRIGDRKADGSGRWSSQEQSGTADADAGVLEDLARANQDYEAKFGHVFLICATGKTATEMLEAARARLANDAKAELQIAAGEQAKITALRLEKLLAGV